MKEGGNPIDQSPVSQANPTEFTEWLLEGYEKYQPIVDKKRSIKNN